MTYSQKSPQAIYTYQIVPIIGDFLFYLSSNFSTIFHKVCKVTYRLFRYQSSIYILALTYHLLLLTYNLLLAHKFHRNSSTATFIYPYSGITILNNNHLFTTIKWTSYPFLFTLRVNTVSIGMLTP